MRSPTRDGKSKPKNSGTFSLEIRVRGKTDYLHHESCGGLEDAMRVGEKWFRAFEARNPWFVQDSKGKRIFILLDPECESLRRVDFDDAQVFTGSLVALSITFEAPLSGMTINPARTSSSALSGWVWQGTWASAANFRYAPGARSAQAAYAWILRTLP